MRHTTEKLMKRGVLALLFVGALVAASSASWADEMLGVETYMVSKTTVVVEVRNGNDQPVSTIINVEVVIAGTPVRVPVSVNVAAKGSTNISVDLSGLLGAVGPVSITQDTPDPY